MGDIWPKASVAARSRSNGVAVDPGGSPKQATAWTANHRRSGELRFAGQIEQVLKFLSVESPAPVIKDGAKPARTPVVFRMDHDRSGAFTEQREIEPGRSPNLHRRSGSPDEKSPRSPRALSMAQIRAMRKGQRPPEPCPVVEPSFTRDRDFGGAFRTSRDRPHATNRSRADACSPNTVRQEPSEGPRVLRQFDPSRWRRRRSG